MTPDQVRSVLAAYEERLQELEADPVRIDTSIRNPDPNAALRHTRWAIGQTKTFIDEGSMEKAMRWLGFIQATLWMTGLYSIDEMRDHNR
jgi:hypothetical protein